MCFVEILINGVAMKKQIKRLSPHQNGKVFGVLMAVATLPMFIPMLLMMSFAMPNESSTNFPSGFLIMFPFMYLIFGYISVVIMCFFYNFLQKFIGGFEYEASESVNAKNTSDIPHLFFLGFLFKKHLKLTR